ncbi:Hypothetical protein Minf_1657 [Methylacidiphilum infernorum V4]|uniref:Uncharacterized protein n=1 Tax=Methylacidiphilum infernorum (isolate V4) TaxID=481448 RepID=B3DWP8_METI4|nr:Hypothetical protein Minf_1657 [Methylacidiphilum infernorum V4]
MPKLRGLYRGDPRFGIKADRKLVGIDNSVGLLLRNDIGLDGRVDQAISSFL